MNINEVYTTKNSFKIFTDIVHEIIYNKTYIDNIYHFLVFLFNVV